MRVGGASCSSTVRGMRAPLAAGETGFDPAAGERHRNFEVGGFILARRAQQCSAAVALVPFMPRRRRTSRHSPPTVEPAGARQKRAEAGGGKQRVATRLEIHCNKVGGRSGPTAHGDAAPPAVWVRSSSPTAGEHLWRFR